MGSDTISSSKKSANASPQKSKFCGASPTNSQSSHTTSLATPDSARIRGKLPIRLAGGPQYICSGKLRVAHRSRFSPLATGTPSCLEAEKSEAAEACLTSTHQNGARCMNAVAVLVSLLYEYARKLLLNSTKRGLLRLKCLARLGLQQRTSDLALTGHTMLANLETAIDTVEKALYNADKNAKAEELERAERIFNALVVLHTEGLTNGVPNSYVVGCAHLYLALIWKLKKNRERAAAHLLETFVASPRYARQDFAPEIWNQLFRPHMISIESWYEHEYNVIDANSLEPGFAIVKPPLPTPKWEKIEDLLLESVCHTDIKSIVNKENRRDSLEGYDPLKLMHMEILNNLFEEALNETTQLYAQFYQDSVNYYGEEQNNQRKDKELKVVRNRLKENKSSPFTPEKKCGKDDWESMNQLTQHSVKHKQQTADLKNYQQLLPPPLRKSLFEAVFGSSMVKANRVIGDFMLKASCDSTQYHQFCHHNAVYDSMEPAGKQRNNAKNMKSGIESGSCTVGKVPGNTLVEVLKGDRFFLNNSEIKPMACPELISNQNVKSGVLKNLVDMLEENDSRTISPMYSPFSIDTCSAGSDMKKVDTESSMLQCLPKPNYCSMDDSQAVFQPLSKEVRDIREVIVMQPEKKSESHIKQIDHSKTSLTGKPPDFFICHLTRKLYIDPVTLETGYTYERSAIEKWLNSGKKTCPLSGYPLENLTLPMTNLTMKSLVEKWKLENPDYIHWTNNGRSNEDSNESFPDFLPNDWTGNRCNSVDFPEISSRVYSTIDDQGSTKITFKQKSDSRWLEAMLSNLKPEMSASWTAQELSKCEGALLKIADAWTEWKYDQTVEIYLMKEEVVDAFIYLLRTSKIKEVLKATACMIVSLMQKNDFVKKQILRRDPECESIFSAANNGRMPDIILLFFFLDQAPSQKQSLDVIPLLVEILHDKQDDHMMEFPSPLTPKQIALLMMEQLVTVFDLSTNLAHCNHAISLGIIPHLIESLNSENIEERTNATSIITRCMQANGDCRYYIATCLNVSSILELLYANGIKGRAVKVAMDFFLEVIRLNRKKSIINILTQIQKDGFLNSMHLLMVVIQCTSLENRPLAAGLLFMLVMLEKPQRYSMFREEAINALVVSLTSESNGEAQANSARVLADLGCHFSVSGESIIEAWLLKQAGLASCIVEVAQPTCSPRQIPDSSKEEVEEEKMACHNWDQTAARALLSYGEPLLVALGKGLCNSNAQVARHCLIVITWLSCFLEAERDKMIKQAVCSILEPKMNEMVKPDHEGAIEERIFAAFALQNYRKACIIKSDHPL